MLPYKETRGREAFESVRVYVGNPFDEDGAGASPRRGDGDSEAQSASDRSSGQGPREEAVEAEVLEGTSLDRLSNIRFVQLGEISENLGANVTW
jgi:large subunit ribosomal protein L13